MLTIFEITLGGWTVTARILQDNVSELYMAFFIFHKLGIGFCVLGVINAVFMNEKETAKRKDWKSS